MKKIYKIFNPQTATYVDAETIEECHEKVASTAWEFYLNYTHSNPYSVCEIYEDGTQAWRNAQGEEILSPEELQQRLVRYSSSPLTSIPATPVEEFP